VKRLLWISSAVFAMMLCQLAITRWSIPAAERHLAAIEDFVRSHDRELRSYAQDCLDGKITSNNGVAPFQPAPVAADHLTLDPRACVTHDRNGNVYFRTDSTPWANAGFVLRKGDADFAEPDLNEVSHLTGDWWYYLSARDASPDQIEPARQNATVVKASRAILSGRFTGVQPDRLAIFDVPYTRKIGPCRKTNLIFESNDPQVISGMLKILGTHEIRDSRVKARTSRTRKLVLALFSEGTPVSWFVITRNYDTVTMYIEDQFPDGKWIATGGKVVNELESWMQQHSLDFEVREKREPIAVPPKGE
jgi:hypothetical protein